MIPGKMEDLSPVNIKDVKIGNNKFPLNIDRILLGIVNYSMSIKVYVIMACHISKLEKTS